MANFPPLQRSDLTGQTLYRRAMYLEPGATFGYVWNVSLGSPALSAQSATRADFAIAFTESPSGTGEFGASTPTGFPVGAWKFTDSQQAGEAAAMSDIDVSEGFWFWDGARWWDTYADAASSVALPAHAAGGAGGLSLVGDAMDFVATPNSAALSAIAAAIAATVLKNADNPLATDSLGRVTTLPTLLGTGSISWPITIQLAGGDPLGNVLVSVSSDSQGQNIVAGPATTDAGGRVIFSLDPGEYYRWADGAGCTFDNPQTFTVSAS